MNPLTLTSNVRSGNSTFVHKPTARLSSYWCNNLQYSEPGASQLIDLKISLETVPLWMETYSKTNPGCGHRILVTMKTGSSQSKYQEFVGVLRLEISPTLCHRLGYVFHKYKSNLYQPFRYNRKEELSAFWNRRSVPKSVFYKLLRSAVLTSSQAPSALSKVLNFCSPLSGISLRSMSNDWRKTMNGCQTLTSPSPSREWLLFFFLNIYLNQSGIVFENVLQRTFGVIWKFVYWTLYFGHPCRRSLKISPKSTEIRRNF
jgi:hypothetical protein